MAFSVPYILLADSVQEVQNAKLNILGTFDQLFLPNVPAQYKSFVVIALVVAGTEDELGEHQMTIRLLRPNGEQAGEGGALVRLAPSGGSWPLSSARIVVQMANVPFLEYGRHRLVLMVDEQELASHPLNVSRPPPSA